MQLTLGGQFAPKRDGQFARNIQLTVMIVATSALHFILRIVVMYPVFKVIPMKAQAASEYRVSTDKLFY